MNEEATIAICVSIAFVGFLVLCFRSYVRYHSQHRPRPTIPALYCINDIFVFIGFLSMISYTVIYAKIIIDRFNSGGQSPTPAHVVVAVANGSRAGWIMSILYIPTMWSAKASLICIYLGASAAVEKSIRYAVVGMAWFLLATFIAAIVLFSLQCLPDEYSSLDPTLCPTEKRIAQIITVATLHLLTDVFVMALGISLVRASFSLHSDRRIRVAIVFIFLLGLSTIIGACIRVGLAVHSFKQFGSSIMHRSHRGAWLSATVAIITLAEMNIALITISIPSLRVLLRSQSRSDGPDELYGINRSAGTSRRTDYDYLETRSGSGTLESIRTEETSSNHELSGA